MKMTKPSGRELLQASFNGIFKLFQLRNTAVVLSWLLGESVCGNGVWCYACQDIQIRRLWRRWLCLSVFFKQSCLLDCIWTTQTVDRYTIGRTRQIPSQKEAYHMCPLKQIFPLLKVDDEGLSLILTSPTGSPCWESIASFVNSEGTTYFPPERVKHESIIFWGLSAAVKSAKYEIKTFDQIEFLHRHVIYLMFIQATHSVACSHQKAKKASSRCYMWLVPWKCLFYAPN